MNSLTNAMPGREAHDSVREQVREHLARAYCPTRPAAGDAALIAEIKQLLVKRDAVLVAHYYCDDAIQQLAEDTGGCVADSLEMARFGARHDASTLIVAGVRFMGETSKILSPEKRVLMPTLEATCSLDLGCPEDEFAAFCDAHPDRTVVVYANTSAAVKARADWVVTSSIAVDVIEHLHAKGEKLIWAPDKHLGAYVQKQTGADMLLWDGACIVHDEFRAQGITDLLKVHPDAAVLVHPESPQSVVELADVVGSTSQLIKAAVELPHEQMIVATDRGIFFKMQQAAPGQAVVRGADRRQWRDLQELCALPVDGDESVSRIWPRCCAVIPPRPTARKSSSTTACVSARSSR